MTPLPTSFAQYRESGYWIGPRIFGNETIVTLRAACARVLSGELEGPVSPHFLIDDTQPVGGLRRAFNAQFVNSVIRSAVYHHSIGELAGHLMGVDAVRLWYSQIIEKPAVEASHSNDIANVGWHQDYRYWQCCEHSNLVTAWIALQETTRANGAMRVVLGSNNWGLLPADKGFNTRAIDELRQGLQAGLSQDWLERDCDLQAGQVSFHHSLTLHASGPNGSAEPRLGIAVHLMPATTRRQGGVCHQSLTFLEPMPNPSAPFSGRQWPIIWQCAPENFCQ